MKKKVISLRLPEPTIERLDSMIDGIKFRSRSQLIRHMITKYKED